MVERDNQVITYLSDTEYSQLKQWSNETGKSMSHLLRDAVMEYTDQDRAARNSEKLDRILGILENGDYTHTQDPRSQSVPETARQIAKRCFQNHEMPMQESDVEIAIEDLGGGDERTIQQYKTQLKKRGLLYKHPLQPVWTDSKRQWVKWVESCTVQQDVHERVQDYDMTTDDYREIAEEIEQ